MPDRRRSFGPTVLLGLAAAGLTAFAAGRPAVSAGGSAGGASSLSLTFDGHMPAVTALSLVVLAAWGVVLVTRGRVRRAVAALGALAAWGAVVAVVVAYAQLGDDLRDQLADLGVEATVGHTGWFWAAALGSLLAAACATLAVVVSRSWPEMGRRYDAPGGSSAAPEDAEDQSNLDLWKAMDEGRDPTA